MIVVTGGAGFIGSNVIRGLNRQGHRDILVVDHLDDSSKWRNLASLEIADYVDKDVLFYQLNGTRIDFFIHLGARTNTMDPDCKAIMDSNFQYSKLVWNFCSTHHIPLVYASSASVYGSGNCGFHESIDMGKVSPLNPYALSKVMFDRWVNRQARLGVRPPSWAGLRFFNVYGPGEAHKGSMSSVVRQAFKEIQNKGYVSLFKSYREDVADGEQRRDFVYISDIVSVILFFFTQVHFSSGFYNCGSGTSRTFNDLAHLVFREMGHEPRIQYVDMPIGLTHQYQYFTETDTQRLRDLGYPGPFTSLEQGIQQYLSELSDE